MTGIANLIRVVHSESLNIRKNSQYMNHVKSNVETEPQYRNWLAELKLKQALKNKIIFGSLAKN